MLKMYTIKYKNPKIKKKNKPVTTIYSNRFGVMVVSFSLSMSTFSYLLRKVKRQKTMPDIVENKNYNFSTKLIIA